VRSSSRRRADVRADRDAAGAQRGWARAFMTGSIAAAVAIAKIKSADIDVATGR
jgi:hypothetical protein